MKWFPTKFVVVLFSSDSKERQEPIRCRSRDIGEEWGREDLFDNRAAVQGARQQSLSSGLQPFHHEMQLGDGDDPRFQPNSSPSSPKMWNDSEAGVFQVQIHKPRNNLTMPHSVLSFTVPPAQSSEDSPGSMQAPTDSPFLSAAHSSPRCLSQVTPTMDQSRRPNSHPQSTHEAPQLHILTPDQHMNTWHKCARSRTPSKSRSPSRSGDSAKIGETFVMGGEDTNKHSIAVGRNASARSTSNFYQHRSMTPSPGEVKKRIAGVFSTKS